MAKRVATQPHRREQSKEYMAEWRDANRDTYNAYFTDRYAEKGQSYHQAYHAARKDDPEYRAKRFWQRIWTKYRVTREAYEAMFAAQNGTCAICYELPIEGPLCVDHDHSTKEFRGLLCNDCNLGIGHFKDNPRRTEAATSYLTKKREQLTDDLAARCALGSI